MPRTDPDARKAYDRARGKSHYAQTLARMATWTPEQRVAHKERERIKSQVWREQYPERHRAQSKAWAMAHPEHVRIKKRQWMRDHAAQKKPKSAAYYLKNKERILENTSAYRKAHPEINAAMQRKRRAAIKGAHINDFTARQWEDMKDAYDHRCAYCERQMQRLTQDHIMPLSRGGDHTYSNIVPACRSCNAKKGTGAVLKPVQPLLFI